MSDRFADLKKIPKQPAARLLAMSNAKVKTQTNLPATASVEAMLGALDKAGAVVDMIRLLSVALPTREGTWWACVAAREMLGAEVKKTPAPLAAAEDWVRKPSEQTREAARQAAELADIDDDTALCATSVVFCDDKLGTGEMAQFDAPPGASASAVFGMVVLALKDEADFTSAAQLMIDRGVDIARGGNGQIKPAFPKEVST